MVDTFDKLVAYNRGLNRRFGGEEPFKIMTRLLEECGELAAQVNHFEGSGVKHEKHGSPDKKKMAKEIQDVLRCAIQVALYYNLVDEIREDIQKGYERIKAEGYLD